ncbi:MAG TPA: DNA primase [Phycisphaerales bacterium]|nr:DNA primase [Phycisphaerales bacterium]
MRKSGGQHLLPDGRDDVERVKDASDIVRVIGEHISLKPKGRELVGLCPFHDDKTPSLCVVPDKRFYKCFSCGAAGDVFTFVQKFHKMEFGEALRFLADRAGVTLARGQREEHAGGVKRSDLLGANERAAVFFQSVLAHEQHGGAARAIIETRGVSPEIVREFRLGAAPDRWDGLLAYCALKGPHADVLARAGLAKAREGSAGHYDTFRNRLMFPICDAVGRVIAFGARRINEDDEPKYLNSPESPLFNKSATLYALHAASRPIQEARTAIVCEGYMDALACHQAGFRNAVATLGTALTAQHAAVLRRLCDRVVLLFDGDDAGRRATDRAAEVFFAEPIDVRVVTLSSFTDAKDPDELLKREGGADQFRAALEHATDLLEYRFARVRERLGGAGTAAMSKGIAEEIERLGELGLSRVEPVRRALIVRQLAAIAGVGEDAIRAALPLGRAPRPRAASDAAPEPETDETELRRLARTPALSGREHLLGCLLCEGSLWSSLSEIDKDLVAPRAYPSDVLRRVAEAVHSVGEDGRAPRLDAILLEIAEDTGAREAATSLAERVWSQAAGDTDRVRASFNACLSLLRRDAEGAAVEVKQPAADAAGLAARVSLLRDMHERHGPDRRRVPRPGA